MRKKTLMMSLATLALALSGCGSSDAGAAAQDDGTLSVDGQQIATSEMLEKAETEPGMTLYTGSGEAGERKLLEQFQEDTGLKADLVRVVPNRLTERILSESSAGQLAADVIRIDGWDLVDQLSEGEAFRKFTPAASIELPEEAIYEDGQYFTTYKRPYILAYNNQMQEEPLSSWADLAQDNNLAGQTGITQVAAAGSTHNLTRFQLDALGETWLEELADTNPRIFDSASPLAESIGRGELVAGPLPLTVGKVAADSGAPITIVAPEEGFPVNEYIVGLANGGESPVTAEIFMNWTLSDAGQKAAVDLGDYPIHPRNGSPVAGDTQFPSLDSAQIYEIDAATYLKNLESDSKTWESIFKYTGQQ